MSLDVVLPESWSDWKIDSVIGEGSFGVVYKAEREEFGQTFYSAIKIMSVPQSNASIQEARMDGISDENSLRTYFYGIVEDWVSEIRMMEDMKGTPNIVGIEDYKVVEKKDSIGWDIFIRMELLTGFEEILRNKKLSENDIIKVGCDICKALEYCERKEIVHRDIKLDNIFVSKFGDYKLGDFGIARHLEKTTAGLSQKGTYTYMAPEVYKGNKYNFTVDIYSLGIVLYRLANHGRAPFYPPYPSQITHLDKENALFQRMSGEALPKPDNAGEELTKVILKACEYDVQKRYHSPEEFRKELEEIKTSGKPEEAETVPIEPTGSEMPAMEQEFSERNKTEVIAPDEISDLLSQIEKDNNGQRTDKKWKGLSVLIKKVKIGIAAVLAVCVISTVGIVAMTRNVGKADKTKQETEVPQYVSQSITFNSESAIKRIDTLSKKHKYKEALEELERLEYSMERKDVDTEEVAEKKKQLQKEQKAYQTLQKYKKVMKKANAYYKKGNYDKAIEQYREAKNIDKTRAKKPNEMIAKCKAKKKALAEAKKSSYSAYSAGGQSNNRGTRNVSPPVNNPAPSYNSTPSNSTPSPRGNSGGGGNSGGNSGSGGGASQSTGNPFDVTDGDDFVFSVD